MLADENVSRLVNERLRTAAGAMPKLAGHEWE
jgi:hypothetical protein